MTDTDYEEYTPTTDVVKRDWVNGQRAFRRFDYRSNKRWGIEFDHWLQSQLRRAWFEGQHAENAYMSGRGDLPHNPYAETSEGANNV